MPEAIDLRNSCHVWVASAQILEGNHELTTKVLRWWLGAEAYYPVGGSNSEDLAGLVSNKNCGLLC